MEGIKSRKFCYCLKLEKTVIIASVYYLVMFPYLFSSISEDVKESFGKADDESKSEDLDTYYFILGVVTAMSLYIGGTKQKSNNVFLWILLSPIYMVINALTLVRSTMFGDIPDKTTSSLRFFDVIIGVFFYIAAIQYYKKLTKSKMSEEKIYSSIENFQTTYVEMNKARYQQNPGSSFQGIPELPETVTQESEEIQYANAKGLISKFEKAPTA